MATAGSIVVDLIARTGSFETDTKRAEKRLRELEKTAVSAGKAIGAGLVAVGAGAAVMAKQAIDAADELGQMAIKAGVSSEALSRLDYAAQLSDVSLGDLGTGLTKLTRFMVESADATSDQAKVFAALGVEATTAAGGLRSADEVFADLADVFAKLPDGAEKTALAIKVFGKSGAELIPLLNSGADGLAEFAKKSDEVAYTLNKQTTQAANDFNDKLGEVKLGIDGLWRQALPGLLPKLDELADLLNSDGFRDGFQTLIGGASTAIGWLAKLATTTASVTKFLGEEVAARVNGPSADDVVRVEQRIDRLQKSMEAVKGLSITDPLSHFSATELIPSDFLKTKDEVLTRLQGELDKEQLKLKFGLELNEESARKAAQIAKAAGDAPTAIAPTLAGLGLLDTGDGKGKGKGRSAREKEPKDLMSDFLKDDREQLERMVATTVDAQDQLNQLAAVYSGPLAQAEYDHLANLARIDELGKLAGATSSEITKLKDQEAIAYGKTTDEILAQQKALEQLGQADALDGLREATHGIFYDLKEGVGIWDSLTNAVDKFADRLFDVATSGLIDQLFGKPGTGGGGQYGDAIGALLGAFGFNTTTFGGARESGGPVGKSACY